MNSEDQLVEQNNQLRKRLTQENEEYYSNLMVYMRLKSFMQDSVAIETELLDILQDILDAQRDSVTAEQYFGKNPKILADELLTQFPKKVRKAFKFSLYFVGIYLFAALLPSMISINQPIDVGNMVLDGMYIGLVVLGVLMYLAQTIYKLRDNKTKNAVIFFKLFLLMLILLVPWVLIQLFVTTPLQIIIGNNLGIAIIIFWIIIGTIIFLKQSQKKMLLPFAIFALVIALLAIFTRLPGEVSGFLRNTQTGHNIIGVILCISLVVFWIITIIMIRKDVSVHQKKKTGKDN